MAQLVEVLGYKTEGRGFDPRFFRLHYGPGVGSDSNKNWYQYYFLEVKGGRRLRLTTLKPSCVDCHDIVEPSGSVQACTGIALALPLPFTHFKSCTGQTVTCTVTVKRL